jgi:hypothetical protein
MAFEGERAIDLEVVSAVTRPLIVDLEEALVDAGNDLGLHVSATPVHKLRQRYGVAEARALHI